jgi:hypothetical protein
VYRRADNGKYVTLNVQSLPLPEAAQTADGHFGSSLSWANDHTLGVVNGDADPYHAAVFLFEYDTEENEWGVAGENGRPNEFDASDYAFLFSSVAFLSGESTFCLLIIYT